VPCSGFPGSGGFSPSLAISTSTVLEIASPVFGLQVIVKEYFPSLVKVTSLLGLLKANLSLDSQSVFSTFLVLQVSTFSASHFKTTFLSLTVPAVKSKEGSLGSVGFSSLFNNFIETGSVSPSVLSFKKHVSDMIIVLVVVIFLNIASIEPSGFKLSCLLML
jgi:hypothetical protein